MHVTMWAGTDIGRVRRTNEDHYLIDPDRGVAVIADGVGGMHRGEVASAIACRVVREHLLAHAPTLPRPAAPADVRHRPVIQARLREAVQRASSEVFRAGATLAARRGMSATLDAALWLGEELFVVHVGDSRVYVIRDARAVQLSEDHTIASEKVRRGEITAEEARSAPGLASLTRAVGALPSVKVDTIVFVPRHGDRVALVTDGVTRHVSDPELGSLLGSGGDEAVADLLRFVNQRGGRDNATAVVLAFHDEPAPEGVTPAQLEDLRSVGAFHGATLRELRAVRALAEEREVRGGGLLFREGEHGDKLYFVLEGEIALTRAGHHLATAGPGAVFGEMALLDQPVRTATALALRDARLLALSRAAFERLRRQDDAAASHLLAFLAERLSAALRREDERYDPTSGGGGSGGR